MCSTIATTLGGRDGDDDDNNDDKVACRKSGHLLTDTPLLLPTTDVRSAVCALHGGRLYAVGSTEFAAMLCAATASAAHNEVASVVDARTTVATTPLSTPSAASSSSSSFTSSSAVADGPRRVLRIDELISPPSLSPSALLEHCTSAGRRPVKERARENELVFVIVNGAMVPAVVMDAYGDNVDDDDDDGDDDDEPALSYTVRLVEPSNAHERQERTVYEVFRPVLDADGNTRYIAY